MSLSRKATEKRQSETIIDTCESTRHIEMERIISLTQKAGIATLVAGITVDFFIYDVDAGKRAVIFDMLQGVQQTTIGEGTHFKIPYIQVYTLGMIAAPNCHTFYSTLLSVLTSSAPNNHGHSCAPKDHQLFDGNKGSSNGEMIMSELPIDSTIAY